MHQHPDLITVETVAPPSEEDRLENKISAGLLGGAIGDAMGWVTEFVKSSRELEARYKSLRIADFVSWEKKVGGRFNPYIDYVGAGEYSDDTQLALCVARSIQPDGTVDNEYFAKVELSTWLTYARGAGATITGAAKAVQRRGAAWNRNFFKFRRGGQIFDYRQAGANGAAMRMAPVAFANYAEPERTTREVWRNTIITHGHPRAIVGALVYAHALGHILREPALNPGSFIGTLKSATERIAFPADDPDLATWLREWEKGDPGRFNSLLSATKTEMLSALSEIKPSPDAPLGELYQRLGCFSPQTKGSAVGTVAAAVAVSVKHGRNFQHAVIEAVNMLGSDTDTIACMAGTIAGAYAGYPTIPEHWTTCMQDFSYFMRAAYALTKVARRKAQGPELRRVSGEQHPRIAHVSSLARATNLASNMRVQHPIFGIGTVRNVDVQPLKGKRDGSMLFVVVLFDSGQTCKFRFFRPGVPKGQTPPHKARRKQTRQAELFS